MFKLKEPWLICKVIEVLLCNLKSADESDKYMDTRPNVHRIRKSSTADLQNN